MKTRKRAILAAVFVLCFCGLIFAGGTIYVDDDAYGQLSEPVGSGHPSAGTNTYIFSSSASSVVKTGGWTGVDTFEIQGQLQLTVDFDAETASFDVVDAYLLDPLGKLSASEKDLGELFSMTELVAGPVDESSIYFYYYYDDILDYEINLFLFFQDISSSRGYVTLHGTLTYPTCYDCPSYEINATMVKKMVFYVDADAAGADDGSSWENAYNHLQDALAGALSGDEIMVAQGSYTPDSNSTVPDGSGDREATFGLIDGVTIKGGYAGGGETDPDARDIEVYETILTGDLNGDDGPDFANNGENSYHVVTSSEGAILDGLTVAAGNANTSSGPLNCGGGMYGGGVLSNCKFIANFATHGGGVNSNHSVLTLSNCVFKGNSAWYGGGMLGGATLTNCIFIGNSASYWFGGQGGGMDNANETSTLTNCVFSGNNAGSMGGGMHNDYSTITMSNCVFSDNSAKDGGGISIGFYSHIKTNITNCTFVSNSASISGGGVYNYDSGLGKIPLINSIFWNNSDANGMCYSSQIYSRNMGNFAVSYSCVQGGYPGVGNIQVDPQFVDFGNGDYHLKSEGWRWCEGLLDWRYDDITSRCIDSGNPGSLLGGELLIIPSDPNHERGENIRVNMGAYGGTVEASMGPYGWALLGDLSNDRNIGYTDLAVQAEDWLVSDNAQPGDLNRDGIVNLPDFAILVEDWLYWSKYPSNPNPKDGSEDIALDGAVLTWTAGGKTIYQDVYFGESKDAVINADILSPEYKGQIAVDAFDVGSFEFMRTYYWRVDQLDESSELIVKGPVWRFSTDECVIVEDFESYDDDGNNIYDVWADKLDWGEMQITVEDDPVISPVNSMRLRYHTVYTPYYNLAVRSFSPAQDWTILGVEVLTINYYGDANNFDLPMFVTVGDGTTDANVVVDVNTTIESWQEINVSLPEIAAAGVDLNSVSYMEIGFGDGTKPAMSSSKSDIIYIDDISLYPAKNVTSETELKDDAAED